MENREAKLTLILGAKGTGKTTLLQTIISTAKERVLICTPDEIEWQQYEITELLRPSDFDFHDVKKFIFTNVDKKDFSVNGQRVNCFTRGFLIFDDCRLFFKGYEYEKEVYRQLIIRQRHKMRDIFLVAHGFKEIPPFFFTCATDIILFRTTDNIAARKKDLKDFDRMLAAQARVNAKAQTQPHHFEHIKFS
ncbi:MAG: hypothetical protein LBB41_06320 [Prevotellaceae bacterium]|jgi:ABC-type cobalamin/Fe3+-siderophores transport system ATPase subunit|nr:hypothetical protein [Prevotellaceae bacterium]